MAGIATTTPPAYPARMFMRPKWENLGAQTLTLGGTTVKFPLTPQGYLDQLLVHVTGTYTVANLALVFGALGAYQTVKSFVLQTPSSVNRINLGGATMHVWNLRGADFAPFRRGFRFPAQGALDAAATYATTVDQVATALGAQTMHQWWVLPFHMAADDPRGALGLGNSTISTLIITPNTIADFVTVAANFTLQALTVEVTQVYYTPPPAAANIIPGSIGDGVAVTYDETDQAMVAGLNKVPISPSDVILGILHGVELNGALDSADVASLYLRANDSWFTDPAGLPAATFLVKQAMEGGVPLPEGWFLYDQDLLGESQHIYTDQLTSIESGITLAAGAVLGADPRVWTSIRRLVPVQLG